jgi:hypothetical protein
MGTMRKAYNIWFAKCAQKRPFGVLRRRWEDNIKMDLKKMGCEV